MRCRQAVLAIGVVALVGCGDGGGGDDGLSQAQLDEQTASICQQGNDRLEAVSEPADISDAAQATTYLASIVEIADMQLAGLQALEPKEELRADYTAYTDRVAESRDFVKGVLAKARAKDPSGLQELQAESESGARDKQTRAAARKAGLTGCARG